MKNENNTAKAGDISPMITADEELLIERLVDGELASDERRELIRRLDETLDGWRFCALSFLEEQTFKEAVRRVKLNSKTDGFNITRENLTNISKRTRAVGNLWRPLAASAVAVLIALGALGVGRYLIPMQTTTVNSLASKAPESKTKNAEEAVIPAAERYAIAPMNIPIESQDAVALAARQPHALFDSLGATWTNPIAMSASSEARSGSATALERSASIAERAIHNDRAILGLDDPYVSKIQRRSSYDDGVSQNFLTSSAEYAERPLIAPPRGGDSREISNSNNRGRLTSDMALISDNFDATSSIDKVRTAQLVDSVPFVKKNNVALLNCPEVGFDDVPIEYSEAKEYKPEEFAAHRTAIPKEVVQQLNTVGGRVEARRNEYRFPLNDGRTLVLPVDDYRVRYDDNLPIW